MVVYDLIIKVTQGGMCFMRCSFPLYFPMLSAKGQAAMQQVGAYFISMTYLGVKEIKTLFKFLKYLRLKKITLKEVFFYVQYKTNT